MEEAWFGSSYYELLYHHRNEEEASEFTTHILKKTGWKPPARVWDMACGNGRHARTWARRGFEVWGTDISTQMIQQARSRQISPLEHYAVHDYRKIFFANFFDMVLNLFTSMGYNRRKDELPEVFSSAQRALKDNGYFLVDYLNAKTVEQSLVSREIKQIGSVEFSITREMEDNPKGVRKRIEVRDGDKKKIFEEYVRLFSVEDFIMCAKNTGFTCMEKWGNYALEPFSEKESPRLILLLRKNR